MVRLKPYPPPFLVMTDRLIKHGYGLWKLSQQSHYVKLEQANHNFNND